MHSPLASFEYIWTADCTCISYYQMKVHISNGSKVTNKRPTGLQSWTRVPLFRMEHMLIMMLRTCLLSSFLKFCPAVSGKKSKMSRPIRGQGSHLGLLTGPKYINLVDDIEILFPVKFPWFPFSSCRGKSKMWKVNDDGRTTRDHNVTTKDLKVLNTCKSEWYILRKCISAT